jgi:membrane carboxypeptidase/penicillin-binding protein PbpC
LKQGVVYNGKLNLAGLMQVDDKYKTFAFGFETIAQNFDVEIERIASDASDAMRKQVIEGQFFTADYADSAQVVKSSNFIQVGADLKVVWEIDRVNGTAHRFKVSGVERKETASEVEIKVNAQFYIPTNLEGLREAVVFEVAHRKAQTQLYWHLDNQYLGMTSGNHTMEVSPDAGLHKITVIDDEGNQIERTFEVLKGE